MLERLRAGYRFRFEALERLAPTLPAVDEMEALARARRRAAESGRPLVLELHAQYLVRRGEAAGALMQSGGMTLWDAWRAATERCGGRVADPPAFECDASLGGLARWLRAAGYEARWRPGGRALERVERVLLEGGILLTSDSHALDFGAVRDRRVLALWLPSNLDHLQQLALTLGDLGLELRDSRCMSCGGSLRRVDKASVRDRIPPRTALWKQEYAVCATCGRLYWEGTHWDKIAASLRRAGAPITAVTEVAGTPAEVEGQGRA